MTAPHIRMLASIVMAALAVAVSASDAFAIRNRYTGQQNDGFGYYFFGGYGRPYAFGDIDEPAYRPYGYGHPVRPYRHRRPDYDGDDDAGY